MKRITTLFILAGLTLTSLGQTYQSLPTTNAVWREKSGGYQSSNCADYQYTITGDTLINSRTYHKLQKTGVQFKEGGNGFCTVDFYKNINEYVGCFREDASNKKVYIIKPFSTSETLLYNFNLSIGDTIPNGLGYVVADIDSVYLGGVYHKRFSYKDCVGRFPYLIEGIGGTYGFLTPYLCPFEQTIDLLCFKVNNQPIYPNNSANCSLIWSVKKIDNALLHFYPNPANSKIFIQLSNSTLRYNKLEIINSNGQKCLSMPVDIGSEPVEVNIEKLAKGLYLVKLMNDEGYIFTKMIKN